jgi:hypothetical protein
MRRAILRLLAVQVFVVAIVWRPAASAQKSDQPLTNADIVKMVKAGVREPVIVATIQSSPGKYNLGATAMSSLRRAGVTQKEIDAMTAAGQPPAPAAAATSTPASGPQAAFRRRAPTVTLTGDGRSQQLPREKTQLAQTKAKPASLSKLASDKVLAQGLQAGMSTATSEALDNIRSSAGSSTVSQASSIMSGVLSGRASKPTNTYVWAVANPASSNVLDTDQPSFSVDFSKVLNVKLDDYAPVVVKLTPAPTGQAISRLVGASVGKEDALSNPMADWEVYSGFMEDRAPIHLQKVAPGKFTITVPSPLAAGEYAVVLRPVVKSKKFSGGDIARNQGDGLLFNTVWSFQVPDDEN